MKAKIICANCHTQTGWTDTPDGMTSHTICPICRKKLYGQTEQERTQLKATFNKLAALRQARQPKTPRDRDNTH